MKNLPYEIKVNHARTEHGETLLKIKLECLMVVTNEVISDGRMQFAREKLIKEFLELARNIVAYYDNPEFARLVQKEFLEETKGEGT